MRTRRHKNKIWKLIIPIAFSQLLLNCSNKVSFNDQELTWLIYKESDKLVFKNEEDKIDTLTILEKKIWHTPYNPGESHGYYIPEIGQLTYTSTFFSSNNKVQKLIEMQKQTPTNLVLTLTLHNTHFFLSSDQFVTLNEPIIINNTSYADIIFITKDPNETIPEDQNQPMTLYWSKTKGLIMFKNYNQDIWTLITTSEH